MLNGTTYMVRPRMHPAEDPLQGRPHLAGIDPVVGRPGVLPSLAADEGAILDPGDIAGIGKGEVAVGTFGGIEPLQGSRGHHLIQQGLVFGKRAVAPVNSIGAGEGRDFRYPFPQSLIGDPGRWIQLQRRGSRLTDNGHVLGSRGYRTPPTRLRWGTRGRKFRQQEAPRQPSGGRLQDYAWAVRARPAPYLAENDTASGPC